MLAQGQIIGARQAFAKMVPSQLRFGPKACRSTKLQDAFWGVVEPSNGFGQSDDIIARHNKSIEPILDDVAGLKCRDLSKSSRARFVNTFGAPLAFRGKDMKVGLAEHFVNTACKADGIYG